MKFFKEKRGITLIALIVTIIVLLILAGVSLNLVAGGNGIIGKAANAVDETNEKTAIEEIELVIAEANMQYYLDDTVTNETLAQYLAKEFNPYTTGSGAKITFNEDGIIQYEGANGDLISLEMDTNGNVEITAKADGSKITKTVTYDANGGTGSVPATQTVERKATVNVDFSTLPTREGYTFLGWATTANAETAQYTQTGTTSFTIGTSNVILYAVWEPRSGVAKSIIQATDYGQAVNYTVKDKANNDITDWKVFLNDGSNVYLIAGDYVPNNGLDKAANIENGIGAYSVKATDNRKTLVDWLTTNSYWNNYATGTSNGVAITGATAKGGPTLPQWVQSWNSNSGYTQLYTDTTSMSDGLTGYYIGNSANPSTGYYDLSSNSGYNNTLYFPRTEILDSCVAYWSISPSADNTNYLLAVGYIGTVYDGKYDDECRTVRPLVCLPATAKMTWNGSQWNLSN